MLQEFKTFIMRGNVMDLAIGVIIGAAFGKIVTSLVEDVLMPPIGMAMSGVDFSKLQAVLKPGTPGPDNKMVGEVALRYGAFINNIIQFVIVAFCVFMLVKGLNKLMPKAPEAAAGPSEVDLLTEIRDSLKAKA